MKRSEMIKLMASATDQLINHKMAPFDDFKNKLANVILTAQENAGMLPPMWETKVLNKNNKWNKRRYNLWEKE